MAAKRYPRGKTAEEKIVRVMREFHAGKLYTPEGKPVTSEQQAIAIALSEARRMTR